VIVSPEAMAKVKPAMPAARTRPAAAIPLLLIPILLMVVVMRSVWFDPASVA